ncbi:MAG: fatty acid desaturase [Acidimicrobiia bacterium]
MPIGVVLGFCSALLTALVTEVYAHRCLAHRAFRVRPRVARVLDVYFRVIVWTSPETWAAIHRLHHRYADTPLDPHSPQQLRPWQVLLGSPYLFAVARRRLPADAGPGRLVVALRALVPLAYVVGIGLTQTLVATLVHLVGYLGIMGMVNTVGHLYGTKPHPEASGYDVAWLAIPLLGHGYHNSHHAHPAAARTGPLDPVWPLLRGLALLRLIELDVRRAGTEVDAQARAQACCGALAGT